MRILWVAPWFRTLAVAWAKGLRERGHNVRIVTSDQHFDPPALHEGDVELTRAWRSAGGAAELRDLYARVRAFRPDVVVTEAPRDPRFLAAALVAGAPVVLMTHDAVPHDDAQATPLMRRICGAAVTRRAVAEVVFSRYVRDAITPRRHRVVVLSLTSEMPDSLTPPLVAAADRRDFLVVGRLSPYKNLPVVLAAYRRHQQSPQFRGDRLVVIGGGDPGCEIPGDVVWERGRYRFADVAGRLAAAKASICLYSAGSQSGVQVMGAQVGVCSLVSDAGGLAEYLPDGERCLPAIDPSPLAAALDRLADPEIAARAGARHRRYFEEQLSAGATSAAWERTLAKMCIAGAQP
ncbi:MAG: glycosyltransferase family 4 protein [Dermatophilaceae bacterium]